MSQLVTGDAVVLGLQPAKVPSRAVSVAVDLAVVIGGYLLISTVLLNAVFALGDAVLSTVFIASMMLVLIGVPVTVETLSRGRSLGKLLFGLRVVREDGGPVRFRHALVRGLVGFVELVVSLGFLALVSSLVSPQGRRLGDVFAGTMVVRERIPVSASSLLPPPPPEWADQFRDLDLSRVPDDLWLTVRQLLVRMPKLNPQVAWTMAARLADDVSRLVGTPPPPGITHPATYLTAVAGERQRRDAERVLGQATAGTNGAVPAGPGAASPSATWPVVPGHSQSEPTAQGAVGAAGRPVPEGFEGRADGTARSGGPPAAEAGPSGTPDQPRGFAPPS